MITTEILDNSDLIDDASALLYDLYIEHGNWQFAVDNPSELRIEKKNGRKLLLDRFTYNARWFGIFDDDKLIGCARLCGLDENGKFEIEGYSSSQPVHEYLPRKNCVEMGKVAVSLDYKGQRIINKLYLVAFEYCYKNRFSVYGCVSNPYIKSLLHRVGLSPKLEQAFKYEPTDSTPVNFYMISYEQNEYLNIINNLRESIEVYLNPKQHSIMEALELVAPILPAPVYWHDRNGVVLGINELCLNGMGVTRENIVGKIPYDFYPQEVAEHILKHNEQIIRAEQILSQEEIINNFTTGKVVHAKAIKGPLYDDNGNVVGIVGTSIDITAEKEAERLKIENQAHQSEKKVQDEFKKIVDQVAHDIRSPLASLGMIIRICDGISEENRISLRQSAERIDDIANNLLSYFEPQQELDPSIPKKFEALPLMVSTDLLEILTAKKYEYSHKPITFSSNFSEDGYFAFMNIDSTSFKRSLSNIINNSVDAFEDNPGQITIHLDTNTRENLIEIIIEDNGKGMPESVRTKILNNIAVTSGKSDGHGIGFGQIRDMLSDNSGSLDIESTIGQGTKIILKFPQIPLPDWMVRKIELNPDDLIIILDDDPSIHGAWESRFKISVPDIERKHFEKGVEVIDFINKLTDNQKQKVFLLTDYELLQQGLHGLNVIEKTGIKRSILVTSHYNNLSVRELASETQTKILPKMLASEVQISLNKN